MTTNLQTGQKVISPDGSGLIEQIIGEEVIVKLDKGGSRVYHPDQLEDDSSAG